jgi:hypothetical protein
MDSGMNMWRCGATIHLTGETISKRLLEKQIYVGQRLIREHQQKKLQPVETPPSKEEISNIVLLEHLLDVQKALAPM